MQFVYILYSASTNKFYKGQTKDINARLKRHNMGMEKYTIVGKPWQLIWKASKETRSEAVILEAKLKNLSRERLIAFMLKYADGIVGKEELALIKQISHKH